MLLADFDIISDSMDTPKTNASWQPTVGAVKYWIIISLFRFFRGFILMNGTFLLLRLEVPLLRSEEKKTL
jgi:hypothetical protein